MQTKLFEIRDCGTYIPALAIKLESRNEAERYLVSRAGYGLTAAEQAEYVYLARIDGGDHHLATYDPHQWGGTRTMPVAHQHIIDHWPELESGAVICVEYLLGERETPKTAERFGLLEA